MNTKKRDGPSANFPSGATGGGQGDHDSKGGYPAGVPTGGPG